jgi:hypothetical protein
MVPGGAPTLPECILAKDARGRRDPRPRDTERLMKRPFKDEGRSDDKRGLKRGDKFLAIERQLF